MKLRSLQLLSGILAGLTALLALPVFAAATKISQTPLIVANPNAVKPNLLFILDDSGSMNYDFLPDHINGDGNPDPKLCRSAGASATNSGTFSNTCCQGGDSSSACWTGNAPFGSTRGHAPYLAASFNGLAYDPTTLYSPPVKPDGTYWASQNRANTSDWTVVKNDAYSVQNTSSINLMTQYPDMEWCTSTAYTDCLRNDNYVLPGTVGGMAYTTYHATVATGSGSVATGAPDNASTDSRAFGPHYYKINTAEYCNSADLTDCRTGSSGAYTIPAPIRWCKTDLDARASQPAAYSCQAVRNDKFTNARYPTKFFAAGVAGTTGTGAKLVFAITTNGCTTSGPNQKKVAVGTFKVGTVDLFGGTPTTAQNTTSALGSAIVSNINAKTANHGYVAALSGTTITVTAPVSAGNLTSTASLTTVAGSACTFAPATTPAFAGYVAPTATVAGSYPGSFTRVDITPGAAKNPNTFPKAASRTDCSGSSCSYDEEMTNFANWWTYYHTRMQAMKSSAALAFGDVGGNRRVGYLSINNNTGKDFLNLDSFEDSPTSTQRSNWFAKLTAAKPSNSTPLRTALSKAGKLYAGKYNGTSLNGAVVADPMQYSCQKNFTILSTDGFWNETATPTKLDGSVIGDQDNKLDRPKYDGTSTANTLADVAAYYFLTDLRTGTSGTTACTSGSTGADVCGNDDPANTAQKMTTFTLGLGASGYMQFSTDYLSGGSKDYNAIKSDTAANPGAGICSWQTSGTCNWPVPQSNKLTAIDDLWHAAVNGGGTYFSAANPNSLYTGLSNALKSLEGVIGAAAAATTSNPNVSAGDNKIFVSNFKSGDWTGDLKSQSIDLESGAVQSVVSWSAQTRLDAATTRSIYLFSSAGTNKLKSFSWDALTTSEQNYFSKAWIGDASVPGRTLTPLSQYCSSGASFCLPSAAQDSAAGEPLVNFLRGVRTDEGELDDKTKYFRARAHVLGDIVNSEAVYSYKSLVNYGDDGYATYASGSRQGMLYVGANDGMLHAINASDGNEVWAYVPTATLPNLFKLADKQYATQHQYFVDSTPVVQDVKIGSDWRTILVSGLGAGGRAYFALDVTTPGTPKALWEFTDDNLGLSFGRPEIGKLKDGTWVVIFASGYNNLSPGDGKGRLFVLNAATGALIRSIVTTAGDTTTPAGLAQIRAWVDNSDVDNTIQRVYGGDNLGNLWRFDVNSIAGLGAAGYDAQRLATLKDASGTAQPITSRPELGQVDAYAMVFVGTGRYLGDDDLTDTSAQTIYGIKDDLGASDMGNPRDTINGFVQQTIAVSNDGCPSGSAACSSGETVRTNGTPQAVNLASNGGWFVDLPQSRERVNTDPQLALGTLVVNSNVIDNGDVCKVGGSAWANFFDYRTGGAVDSAKGVTSVSLGGAIATRPALVRLPNNKVVSITRLSNDRTATSPTPVGSTASATRRLSWRDLIQQ